MENTGNETPKVTNEAGNTPTPPKVVVPKERIVVNAPRNNNSGGRLTLKGLIVAGLILLLLIPTAFINSIIREREDRRHEAVREVSQKWAGQQTITGPLVVIPYMTMVKNEKNINVSVKRYLTILPEDLKINGNVKHDYRNRSIFKVVVYQSQIQLNGSFAPVKLEELGILPEDLLLDEAEFCLSLSDFKGIDERLIVKWDSEDKTLDAGSSNTDITENSLSTPLKLDLEALGKSHDFSMKLSLKGSESIYFTPVGKSTEVHLTSSWPTPSFNGNFLPSTSADITKDGFSAEWKVLNLNRNYPQIWKNNNYSYEVNNSAFGVTLLQASDSYAQTHRSVKYAILFIALTFVMYFFIEVLQKKQVHPLQYALVGLGLCVFYTLLLSLSEYIDFKWAYLAASVAVIAMVTLYTKSIFNEWKTAGVFAGVLTMLYAFIFVLTQLEDGALLVGSIGLFILLAIIMYYSRKIDWYGNKN